MKTVWIVFILLPLVSGYKAKKHQFSKDKSPLEFDRAVLSKVPLSSSLLDNDEALEKDFDAQNIGNFKDNPWRLMKPFGLKKQSSNKAHHKKDSKSLGKKKVDRKEKWHPKDANKFELHKDFKAEGRKEWKVNRNNARVPSPRRVGKWKKSKESLRKSNKHDRKSKKVSTKKWQKKKFSKKMSSKQIPMEDDLVKVSRNRKLHRKTHDDKNKLKGCYRKEACSLKQRPLCGSDGKTYGNKCMLRMAACMKGDRHAILPAHKGRCKE